MICDLMWAGFLVDVEWLKASLQGEDSHGVETFNDQDPCTPNFGT